MLANLRGDEAARLKRKTTRTEEQNTTRPGPALLCLFPSLLSFPVPSLGACGMAAPCRGPAPPPGGHAGPPPRWQRRLRGSPSPLPSLPFLPPSPLTSLGPGAALPASRPRGPSYSRRRGRARPAATIGGQAGQLRTARGGRAGAVWGELRVGAGRPPGAVPWGLSSGLPAARQAARLRLLALCPREGDRPCPGLRVGAEVRYWVHCTWTQGTPDQIRRRQALFSTGCLPRGVECTRFPPVPGSPHKLW